MLNLGVSLVQVVLGLACITAPVIAALLYLHYRERREVLLNAIVLKELNLPELRGLYTVQLRTGFWGSDNVMVDLWGCSREQVWDVLSRLSARLPARVHLALNGISDPGSRSALTLKIERRMLTCPAPCLP